MCALTIRSTQLNSIYLTRNKIYLFTYVHNESNVFVEYKNQKYTTHYSGTVDLINLLY